MPKKRQTSHSAKSKTVPKKPSVHADMNVLEIIALHPDAAGILEIYGLHCHGCAFGSLDTLRTGALSHGLTDDDVENMIDDLTEAIKKAPSKPLQLTLTPEAAKALLEIAAGEGKTSCMLRVLSDESGGFCMEFAEEKEESDILFEADGQPNASLLATPETLFRIGGSTVDFRDERFKLDLVTNCECESTKVCKCESR